MRRRLARTLAASRAHATRCRAAVARPARRVRAGRRHYALRRASIAPRLLPALGESGRPPAARLYRRTRRASAQRGPTRSARALQLTNFWQDVGVDCGKGRIYIPTDDLERLGVGEADRPRALRRALERADAVRDAATRDLMLSGRRRCTRIAGRASASSCAWSIQGGLRILERIDARGGDVFRRRPTLRAGDWLAVIWRGCGECRRHDHRRRRAWAQTHLVAAARRAPIARRT